MTWADDWMVWWVTSSKTRWPVSLTTTPLLVGEQALTVQRANRGAIGRHGGDVGLVVVGPVGPALVGQGARVVVVLDDPEEAVDGGLDDRAAVFSAVGPHRPARQDLAAGGVAVAVVDRRACCRGQACCRGRGRG